MRVAGGNVFRNKLERVMNRVYIGASGWVYKDWQKHFYPPDVPAKRHFEFYATHFSTVEINATFYRLPTLNMVKGWRDKAPPGFVFAVKGSRFITHIKRLKAPAAAVKKYFSRINPMRGRVGRSSGKVLTQSARRNCESAFPQAAFLL